MPRKAGHRYPLLIYSRMINRWWPATLTLALGLFTLAWGLSRTVTGGEKAFAVNVATTLGGFVLVVTVFLFLIRNAAYVRPFNTYLRLATPFFRINISYRRIKGTSTSEMYALFPPKSVSGWRREIIEPLASKTALVIKLTAYPMSPMILRLFLSPFFFKDKTPHFVILVKDWMRFSSDLDSMRMSEKQGPRERRRDNSILSRLPHQ